MSFSWLIGFAQEEHDGEEIDMHIAHIENPLNKTYD